MSTSERVVHQNWLEPGPESLLFIGVQGSQTPGTPLSHHADTFQGHELWTFGLWFWHSTLSWDIFWKGNKGKWKGKESLGPFKLLLVRPLLLECSWHASLGSKVPLGWASLWALSWDAPEGSTNAWGTNKHVLSFWCSDFFDFSDILAPGECLLGRKRQSEQFERGHPVRCCCWMKVLTGRSRELVEQFMDRAISIGFQKWGAEWSGTKNEGGHCICIVRASVLFCVRFWYHSFATEFLSMCFFLLVSLLCAYIMVFSQLLWTESLYKYSLFLS